jgi:hypothetical protein
MKIASVHEDGFGGEVEGDTEGGSAAANFAAGLASL